MPAIPARLFIFLLLYHLFFTMVFHQYLMVHGGDSRAYWEFTIVNYRPASQWMDYFEYGNFFMQWLNYFPAQQWGLPYFVGNLIYSLLGFLGFAELLRLALAHWGWKEGRIWENSWVLALFLPGVHFWTAGIGKEAVLWIGTIWVLKGLMAPLTKGYWALLGLFLTLMTRPIHGALLLLIASAQLIIKPKVQSSCYRWTLWSGLVLGATVAFVILLRQTHLSSLSMDAVLDFLSSQQQFLESLGAKSYIPMQEYGLAARIWTVLFRPLPWEAQGIWQWAAAIENMLLLISCTMAALLYSWNRPSLRLPHFLVTGLVLTGCVLLVYSYTLNNFGILVRMKSIFMPFIGFLCWHCIVFSKKRPTFD